MIFKKEIQEFKKIYSKNSDYGIAEWKKEQKELIHKWDDTTLENKREKLLLDLMYEEKFGNNENVVGKELLLQFVIVLCSIIPSIVLSIMVFVGDLVNGIIIKNEVSQDSFWTWVNGIVEAYIEGTLDIGGLIINLIAGSFGLLLIAEVLFVLPKVLGKKDLIVIRRYYTCMIELIDEETKYREEKGIVIVKNQEQLLSTKYNSSRRALWESMKELKPKIKNKWLNVLLPGVLIVSFIPVLILGTNFKENEQQKNNFVENSMGIYVEWLGALSPLVLGLVAVTQSDRLQKLEERIVHRDNSCNIMLEDKVLAQNEIRRRKVLTNDGYDKYEKSDNFIVIEINNYSNAFLKEIEIVFGENIFHSNLTVINNKEKIFKIILPKNYDISLEQRNKVMFTSCYGVKTYGDFVIDSSINDDGSLGIKQYHFRGIDEKLR